jgi:hypothetical protein
MPTELVGVIVEISERENMWEEVYMPTELLEVMIKIAKKENMWGEVYMAAWCDEE